jgi:hypothetical protein
MSASLLSSSARADSDVSRAAAQPQAKSASHVLPPSARPYGYSVSEMARITAAFNESDRTGPPPESPFQILFGDGSGHPSFNVTRGTDLYVPVVYRDESLPLLGDSPAKVETRRRMRTYCYSQTEIGAVAREVIVDGIIFERRDALHHFCRLHCAAVCRYPYGGDPLQGHWRGAERAALRPVVS